MVTIARHATGYPRISTPPSLSIIPSLTTINRIASPQRTIIIPLTRPSSSSLETPQVLLPNSIINETIAPIEMDFILVNKGRMTGRAGNIGLPCSSITLPILTPPYSFFTLLLRLVCRSKTLTVFLLLYSSCVLSIHLCLLSIPLRLLTSCFPLDCALSLFELPTLPPELLLSLPFFFPPVLSLQVFGALSSFAFLSLDLLMTLSLSQLSLSDILFLDLVSTVR